MDLTHFEFSSRFDKLPMDSAKWEKSPVSMEIESVFKVVASGGRRRMCGKALTPYWANDDCDSPNSMSQKKSLESADDEFSLLTRPSRNGSDERILCC